MIAYFIYYTKKNTVNRLKIESMDWRTFEAHIGRDSYLVLGLQIFILNNWSKGKNKLFSFFLIIKNALSLVFLNK